MKALRSRLAVSASVLLIACLALAAPAAGPKAGPASQAAADPVLKVIPAGTLGYVVLNNLKTATDDVDKFLKQTHLADLLKDEMPEGALKAILNEADLGEGLNPNGGVAVAMLDPAAFGIDLFKLLKSAIPGAGGAASAPAGGAAANPPLPVVVFVPGSGVKEVFGKFKPEVAEPYMKFNLEGTDIFAAPLGSYILLSPNPKALEAVAKAPQKADDELKGRHAVVVRNSAMAVRVNMKAVYPVLQKTLKALDLLITANDEGLVDDLPKPVRMYKDLRPMMGVYLVQLAQMDELTLGVRLAETGVVADAAVGYSEGSTYAKATAAAAGPQPSVIDLLPGKSYMVALSQTIGRDAASKEVAAKNYDALLSDPGVAKLLAPHREKIQALEARLFDEVESVGFVMNVAPEDSKGMMSMSLLLKGRDGEKIKALLADAATLGNDVVKSLTAIDKELKGLKFTYEKGTDKVGQTPVDTVKVEMPEELDGMMSMGIAQALGEGGLSPRVASADKNTVVITLGGGTETMARALKAAAGNQEKEEKILAAKEAGESLKFMPKNPQALFLFNVGGYFEMIQAVMKKAGGGLAIPLAMPAGVKTPLAFGMGAEGATQVITFYLPTDVVKEVAGFFLSIRGMMGGGGGPAPAPVPGGDDF